MKFYVIKYNSNEKGCPQVLKGDLNTDWEWDVFDPCPDKFVITHNYVYKAKHAFLNFDFWNLKCLASDSFVNILEKYGVFPRVIPVEIIQSNNKNTAKNYSYILWRDWIACMDTEKSDCSPQVNLESGLPVSNKYFPSCFFYEKIKKFVIDESKTEGKHIFKSVELFDEVICSESFVADVQKNKLVGIDFIPLEDFQRIPYWEK